MKRKDFHWKVHALGTCPDGGRGPGSEVHYETWSWAGGRGRRRGPWVTGRVMLKAQLLCTLVLNGVSRVRVSGEIAKDSFIPLPGKG